MNKRILIAAGGSGGHLLPARQLASQLLKKPCDVFFMGSGLAKSPYFQQNEFPYHDIPSASIRKKNPLALFTLLKGTWKSLRILRKQKVDLVVGFGSFHSFPVLLAARILRLPMVIFEANCIFGKVNSFFASYAKVAVQFPLKGELVEPLPWVKPQKIEAPKKELFTLLVFGGSQGAVAINQLIAQAAPLLKPFKVIHLTGTEEQQKEMEKVYSALNIPCYVRSFETDMPKVFAEADVVICRSGASTIAELIYFEKPALMIPYPHAAENHQEINAQFMENQVGGGITLKQSGATLPVFVEHVQKLWHNYPAMTKRIQEYKKNEPAKRSLADLIWSELHG